MTKPSVKPSITKIGPTPAADDKISLNDKIKLEKKKIEDSKKKAMDAWADSGEDKSFGLIGMIKFTMPRLWKGGCM